MIPFIDSKNFTSLSEPLDINSCIQRRDAILTETEKNRIILDRKIAVIQRDVVMAASGLGIGSNLLIPISLLIERIKNSKK